ncbi:ea59 protein [marine gamma proteobacterium HTCC2143]|uniref:Ea59 protein n=1 Tax=marine gamma proteobacterium HTCC2143 TaxID=247633 RepID=A0YFV1_9GAMM|nr:ea59 protein [marine gamma proteobacterium HTCC2143]
MALIFKKLEYNASIPRKSLNTAYLQPNNWDDFHFKTLFKLTIFDEAGEKYDVGNVKIGYVNQVAGWTSKNIEPEFKFLSSDFFSLGQDEDYYKNITKLNGDDRKQVLTALRDVVYDEGILQLSLEHDVMKTSLLREVSLSLVSGPFRRVLGGGELLTDFDFGYSIAQGSRTAGLDISFSVDPDSNPPTNIHVLIGRNGVGKTHLLNNMVKALVAEEESEKNVGAFYSLDSNERSPFSQRQLQELFSSVVSVAFSAFDPFEPYPEQKDKTKGVRYSYVGLKRATNHGGKKGTPMSRDMLTKEFLESLSSLIDKGYKDQWITTISGLEADDLFSDIDLAGVVKKSSANDLDPEVKKIFNKLSSGHSIVLLTLTKLVEKVRNQTLVLLDEPEGHLHPPLLSAFIRTLSDLLSHRNGIAIIATHSPVILQEVPKSCVWKLRRTGLDASAERPEMETFGENVGVLTREVFNLEATESGYHQLLKKEMATTKSYKKILRNFNGQLGAEARGVLRGLLLVSEAEEE